MDFLLSFRPCKRFRKLEPEKETTRKDLYLQRSALERFLLLPIDSRAWMYCQIPGVCLRFVLTTYTLTFFTKPETWETYDYPNVMLDLFFLVDLISAIVYRVKWPSNNRILTKSSSHLSKLSWRNSFFKPRAIWMMVVDIISVIPFEFIVRKYTKRNSVWHALAHLAPAVRIYRLPFYSTNSSTKISLQTHAVLEVLLKFSVSWLILSHSITCFWRWYMWYNNSDLIGIFKEKKFFNVSRPISWYWMIFYFAQIGILNIGFGDITVTTDGERVFVSVFIFVGFIVINGYLISALSNILAEQIRRLTILRFRISLMESELEQKKVPQETVLKIIKFYHSLWNSRKGIGPINEMLLSLPESLWSQVYYDIFKPALDASLLFGTCDDISKRALTKVMRIDLFMAGDVILKRNEINSTMFYIRKGKVQIMSYQDDETEIMTFGAGSVFGQIALLLSLPAKSEVHAATFCEIHLIDRKELFLVLSDYPKALEIVRNVHRNILLNVLADKFNPASGRKPFTPENVLPSNVFYKIPQEASRLPRSDLCVINTCPYVFEPDTVYLLVWSVILAIIILIICVYYPYCAVYTRVYPLKAEPFIILIDIFLLFNLYISLSTAYVRENVLFSNPREIFATKLTEVSTYVDVISLLPLHYCIDHRSRQKPIILCLRCLQFYKYFFIFYMISISLRSFSTNYIGFVFLLINYLKIWWVSLSGFCLTRRPEKAILCLVSAILLYSLFSLIGPKILIHLLFSKAESSVDLKMVGFLRLIKYVLYFFYGGYLMGIIYYLEACYSDPCGPDSWYAQSTTASESKSPIWMTLYFAILVMSGTGYGDITASNERDVLFAIACCLGGVFLFIYLIAEYSANLSLSKEPRMNFIELAERVNSFLRSHNMLPSETLRVRQYLNLQWERNKGYEFTSNHNLFHDIPTHLLSEINQYTKSRALQNLKIFKGVSDVILKQILSFSSRKVFPPHEVVIYAGDICSSLIVIEEGYCEVTYGKDVSQKKIIRGGDDIATMELFLGITSLCHVRTITHCSVLKVPLSIINRAFSHDIMAAKEFKESIAGFLNSPVIQNVKQKEPVRLHLVVRSSVQKSVFRFRFLRKQKGIAELRDPFMRLGLCQWIRYFLGRMTILPYGKFLKIWELSRCFFAFWSAMIFPLLPFFELQVKPLYYVGYFLDITAWIDLYFRLHVCFYNKKNLLVSHPLSTSSHYIRGSFTLDFIFCFPFDRIMYRSVYDSSGYALVTTRAIDILRLLRVGQVYRIPTTVVNLGADFLSSPSLFRIMIMMIGLTLVFLNFLTSAIVLLCVNYKLNKKGQYDIVMEDYVKEHVLNVQKNYNFTTEPFYIFLVNFYWISETAFGLGFGDITAGSKELMISVIFVIIFSYLFFNYVTIMIASHLSSINVNLTIFQKRMSQLIKYLKAENIEQLLRKHIINHFEYAWRINKGMKAQFIFANFPVALKNDVMVYLFEETLKGVEAFADMDQSFFRLLSFDLNEINLQIGAAIYKKGDIISDIYIIHQGEVTLVGKDEHDTIVLGPSKVFGLLDNAPRGMIENSAVATKNVTVLTIKTRTLYTLLKDYHGTGGEQGHTEELKFRKALEASNKEDCEAQKRKKFIPNDNPYSFVRLAYRFSKHIMIAYVVLSLFSINEVTYTLAFQSCSTALICVIVPVELLFIFKIFIDLTTGYVNEAGEFISSRRLIATRHLKSPIFYLDVFATIPFEIFAFAAPKNDQLLVASWLRITKLLRIYYISYFFNLKLEALNVNMVLLKTLAVAVWTGTLLHQCVCLWFLVSCYRAKCPNSKTWNLILEGHFHNMYISSLYFVVVVLTTTGFGDAVPHTILEIITVDFLMFVAFFYTAIFIGQIISTTQKTLYAKTHFDYQVEGMKTYLHVNDVPNETQKMIFRYVKNLWQNEKGSQIPELLKSEPLYIIREIKDSAYGHHINNNPVFKTCNPYFKKQLIYRLYRTVYFCGDVIVNEGEVNRKVYFVHYGLVEGKHSKGKQCSKVYEKNTFFGLRQGVRLREPHKMTYTAITYTVILSLHLKHWNYLSEFFPDDMKYIEKMARDCKWD